MKILRSVFGAISTPIRLLNRRLQYEVYALDSIGRSITPERTGWKRYDSLREGKKYKKVM